MAPDGSGRPRRERTGLRRRPGPGRRSGRGAEGAPPAERARGRLRGAGAGARAGSRGGYDDPAAGPRISSPPPPHGSPRSRLRTRHTGGESGRAGRVLGRERPPICSRRRDRAGRGLSGKPGLRGTPLSGCPHPGPGAVSCGPAFLGLGGDCVPRKVRRRRACFRGNSPCLLPLVSWACCCPQMTGGRLASPRWAGFFPRLSWQIPSVWLVRVYFTALLITMVVGYLCCLGPGSGVWKGRRRWGGCGTFPVVSADVL